MKPYGTAAKLSVLVKCKAGAKDRGIPFELTDEQAYALFEQPCHYCGEEPRARYTDHYNGSYLHSGIDRKDSSKGYTVDNCVSCCPTCNFMKRARPYEEWVAWLDRMAK